MDEPVDVSGNLVGNVVKEIDLLEKVKVVNVPMFCKLDYIVVTHNYRHKN